jgi:hypothetical protein
VTLAVRTVLAAMLVSICVGCSPMSAGVAPSGSPTPLPDDSGRDLAPQPNPKAPVQACGVEGVADAAFVVPARTSAADWLPGLDGATELDRHDGSLVVLYAGTARLPYLTGIPGASRDQTLEGVVCVVTPDGEPNVYSDVSRDGVQVPPGVTPRETWSDTDICEVFVMSPTC